MNNKCSLKFIFIVLILMPLLIALGRNVNAAWDPMTFSPGTGDQIIAVWGTSETDVWAVGDAGLILHYSGAANNMWETPDYHPSGVALRDIWGASANNIYAVGDFDPATGSGKVLNYNGTSWTDISDAAAGGTVWPTGNVLGVWGSTASDVFIVCDSGEIWHWNGGVWNLNWTLAGGPPLTAIWGSSATNVYATDCAGNIFFYNGGSWSPNSLTSITTCFTTIWGDSANDIYAGGWAGAIAHYNGTAWNNVSTGLGVLISVNGIWGYSGTDVFAVGSTGTILHYDGTGWGSMVSNTTEELIDVWGSNADNIFVVGGSPGSPTALRFTPDLTTTTAALVTTTSVTPTTVPATTTTKKGICTTEVIYGENSEEVELLRYLRDDVLSKTPEGREIIRLYYQLSPVIVKAMDGDEEFKEEVKEMIDGVLLLVRGEE